MAAFPPFPCHTTFFSSSRGRTCARVLADRTARAAPDVGLFYDSWSRVHCESKEQPARHDTWRVNLKVDPGQVSSTAASAANALRCSLFHVAEAKGEGRTMSILTVREGLASTVCYPDATPWR